VSNNGVTLKPELGVIQGHWKCGHLIECIQSPIGVPYYLIFYHFRDKVRYWSKVAISSHPLHLTPSLGEFLSEYCWVWKTRIMCLPGGGKSLRIQLLILTKYTKVTDRQTDTQDDSIRCVMHSIARQKLH